jgi:LacI family transcriptional regulator
MAGVSIATVSRLINNGGSRVRKSTAERLRKAIEEINYRLRRAGRALRTKRTQIVAVLVPDALNTLLAAVTSSIEMSLREDERVMFLCNTMGDPEIPMIGRAVGQMLCQVENNGSAGSAPQIVLPHQVILRTSA